MITDVLYSITMYIRFCVKHFELSHVIDIELWKCYVLLLLDRDRERDRKRQRQTC